MYEKLFLVVIYKKQSHLHAWTIIIIPFLKYWKKQYNKPKRKWDKRTKTTYNHAEGERGEGCLRPVKRSFWNWPVFLKVFCFFLEEMKVTESDKTIKTNEKRKKIWEKRWKLGGCKAVKGHTRVYIGYVVWPTIPNIPNPHRYIPSTFFWDLFIQPPIPELSFTTPLPFLFCLFTNYYPFFIVF